jgi:hypothetical protein
MRTLGSLSDSVFDRDTNGVDGVPLSVDVWYLSGLCATRIRKRYASVTQNPESIMCEYLCTMWRQIACVDESMSMFVSDNVDKALLLTGSFL